MDVNDSSFINEDVLTGLETWIMCDEVGYINENYDPNRIDPMLFQVYCL